MAEWLKATDCKSVLFGVRRFESFSAHFINVEMCRCENVKMIVYSTH
jgi:hypothetical protein